METFSLLLDLCEGNSLVTGGFLWQRPVTRSFDGFFDLRLNKRLNKQSRRRWFETLSRSLCRHCSVLVPLWYNDINESFRSVYINTPLLLEASVSSMLCITRATPDWFSLHGMRNNLHNESPSSWPPFNNMMTSSNGNIFRVTGPLWGESTGHTVDSPHNGQWRGALMFSLIYTWSNGCANNRDAGDLRRHHAHYYIT